MRPAKHRAKGGGREPMRLCPAGWRTLSNGSPEMGMPYAPPARGTEQQQPLCVRRREREIMHCEAPMRTMWFTLLLSALAGGALAQTGGAPSGGAASSQGAAPSAPAPRSSSPTGAPTVAPNAPPNSTIFPPSRLLPTPAPSTPTPGQSGGTPPPGAATPGAPTGADPNLPATASGGRPQPGGANSSEQSTRTGKNPINERYVDCVKLWDSETHMSKSDWSNTCRRIENRLQNLQVENLNTDLSGSKPRKSGRGPGAAAELKSP